MSLKNTVIGGLTVPQRDRLLNMLREWVKFKGQYVNQPQHSQQLVHHYVVNNSGEEIPSYACIQITGTEEQSDSAAHQNLLIGEKPKDDTGENGWYAFNGFAPIADGEIGIVYDGPLVRSLVTGSYDAGELLSPEVDSWYLTEGSLYVYAGPDDILDDVHKVFTVAGGKSGCELMIFSVDAVYHDQAASDHCDDQLNDAKDKYKVTCVESCCGGKPSGAEPDGKYLVHDRFKMFQGGIGGAREEADVIGKEGIAIRMNDCDGYDECKWYVLFINWFRTIQVVTNVVMTDTELKFELKNVEVWDDCDLDPIVIPLTDCEDY